MRSEKISEVKVEERKSFFGGEYQEVSFKYEGHVVKALCTHWGHENMVIDGVDCAMSFTREGAKELIDAIFDESDDVVSLRNQDHESDAEIQNHEEKEVHFSEEGE